MAASAARAAIDALMLRHNPQQRAAEGIGSLARSKDPRTALLRQLSELNARWAGRLAARGAGTDRYREPEGGEPYLEAVRQLLAGNGVAR
jgi:hypothetical protein